MFMLMFLPAEGKQRYVLTFFVFFKTLMFAHGGVGGFKNVL